MLICSVLLCWIICRIRYDYFSQLSLAETNKPHVLLRYFRHEWALQQKRQCWITYAHKKCLNLKSLSGFEPTAMTGNYFEVGDCNYQVMDRPSMLLGSGTLTRININHVNFTMEFLYIKLISKSLSIVTSLNN